MQSYNFKKSTINCYFQLVHQQFKDVYIAQIHRIALVA
jgi:hypothetical protein